MATGSSAFFGEEVDCEEVGVHPMGAQLASPSDRSYPDEGDPGDSVDPEGFSPIDSEAPAESESGEQPATQGTIKMPDATGPTPSASTPIPPTPATGGQP